MMIALIMKTVCYELFC